MEPMWKRYVLLHLLLLIYSFGGVCSKAAAKQEMFSFKFFAFYGVLVSILVIYSVFWQQIIKYMPLSIAYLNKPVSVLWGIIWGVVLFQEQLTVRMIVGAMIVLCGMVIVVRADE